MRIYIAGPLFSEQERKFNDYLNDFLTERGHETFLPQKHGHELANLMRMDSSGKKISDVIFNCDIDAIKNSDVILFIMDGRVPDEGACVEIGYAYALGKDCIGLKTDSRVLMFNLDNPMITGALKNRIARNLEQLVAFLAEIDSHKIEKIEVIECIK